MVHHKVLEYIDKLNNVPPGAMLSYPSDDWRYVAEAGRVIQLKLEDNINSPKHYSHNRLGIECIQAIEASMSKEQFIGWLKGQIIKYIWRFEYKGKPVEDCKKAQFYLNRLIEELPDDKT